MNNYEKARLLRVQENKERLRELGVKSVAKSLTSLVESKKKKKKKVYPTYFNMRDDNYSHEMSDDSDKDNPEVATNVQIAKKQHRQRYIAPMSMTKIANMAKQRRVIAPNVLDSNVIKDHHSKETITMDYVDQDDEYEEMDQIASANFDDETHGDNEHDELEDEDDELLHDELQHLKLEKAIGISKTKKRGPTMLHDVHTRIEDEREVIICNEFGQPVGPVREGNDVVGKFSRFLGTVARNYSHAPLIHSSWQKVPHKEKIWEYVLEKYDVPDGATAWVLKSIGQSYKVHKCRFKQKHFYQFKDNKTRWNNRPNNIPEDDLRQLLRLWSNKNVEKRCARAKQSRMSQKNMHTAGLKSFARIREEMEQMKNYKAAENENTTIDPFLVVMNKENYGYRRLYGRGVTNTLIKKVEGPTSYMIPDGLIESFKANVDVEKNQLLEMRKEIEDDHERQKAELEAIREDIDSQRQNLEAMMQKLPIKGCIRPVATFLRPIATFYRGCIRPIF
ncbi:hypothetical protein E3N88_24181 [Mikania micrantha]|uniref:Uncharacterized protein n=1 Tax=Mikania micrantha TaxID=192012 RepID=A0A5N6NH13_9ASTR|nr:hypothetical protein E3N88_24181 [Mikania micrantha]